MIVENQRKKHKLFWILSLSIYKLASKLVEEQKALRKWYKIYSLREADTFEAMVINELF